MASIARYVICDALNPAITAATQWFERTLDDSANKRVSIAEAFLAVDGILTLYSNVSNGLVVYPKVIARHLDQELPFMASENFMMDAVKAGGDRQELHEAIRVHAQAAAANVKQNGGENDFLARLAQDEHFSKLDLNLKELMDPLRYVGRAPEQTKEYLAECVKPFLVENASSATHNGEVTI